jgi:hypothetical protein
MALSLTCLMQLVPAELREKAGDKAIEIAYKKSADTACAR